MGTFRTATVGALVALLLALPLRSRAACQVEMLELPVAMIGSRAVATVGINGKSVPLTVDTGAIFSMLTDAAAAQLDLSLRDLRDLRVYGIAGRVDARLTRVDKLQLLKGELRRVEFIVGVNEPGAGTMGLLGRNILSFADTEYDLAHGMIRFAVPNDGCAKANLAYWAGTSHVNELALEPDYHTHSPIPALRARVKLNGTDLVALLDTGATTVITAQAARRAGITDAQMTPAGEMYGAGRGSAKGWTAPFDRVEIGDEAITHNRLPIGDFTVDDADLLLGIDFFLSHRIYVSKQQSKMYITYNGGTVFALNRGDSAGTTPREGERAASSTEVASAEQLARRAAAFASRRDYPSALADLNRAIELEPKSAAHLAQRGAVLDALGRPAKAMEDFHNALELDPADVDARWGRAVLRLRAGDADGARSDVDVLDRALAAQANLRLPMSQIYLDLERPAQSLVQLNHWLAARPSEVHRHVALNRRCWARMLLGVELDKALDDCNQAIDADKSNAAYLDSRGWVHLRLGRYDRALADFDRSIALHPDAPWTLYGRGLARSRAGDAAQGEADLAAARKAQADIDVKVARAGLMAEQAPKQ